MIFSSSWSGASLALAGDLPIPADPMRSHATALIIVKEHGVPFPAVDIVSHSRVGSMVKKQVFFVSVDPATDQVVYIALNHARLMTRQEL